MLETKKSLLYLFSEFGQRDTHSTLVGDPLNVYTPPTFCRFAPKFKFLKMSLFVKEL